MKNLFKMAMVGLMTLFCRSREPEHQKVLSECTTGSNTMTFDPSPEGISRRARHRKEFRTRQLRDHYKLPGFETVSGRIIYALNRKNADRKAAKLQTFIV